MKNWHRLFTWASLSIRKHHFLHSIQIRNGTAIWKEFPCLLWFRIWFVDSPASNEKFFMKHSSIWAKHAFFHHQQQQYKSNQQQREKTSFPFLMLKTYPLTKHEFVIFYPVPKIHSFLAFLETYVLQHQQHTGLSCDERWNRTEILGLLILINHFSYPSFHRGHSSLTFGRTWRISSASQKWVSGVEPLFLPNHVNSIIFSHSSSSSSSLVCNRSARIYPHVNIQAIA